MLGVDAGDHDGGVFFYLVFLQAQVRVEVAAEQSSEHFFIEYPAERMQVLINGIDTSIGIDVLLGEEVMEYAAELELGVGAEAGGALVLLQLVGRDLDAQGLAGPMGQRARLAGSGSGLWPP